MRPPSVAVGERYGHLVVVEELAERSRSGQRVYRCLCECGTEKCVRAGSLRSAHTQSCGCLKRGRVMTGQRFGRLTVVGELAERRGGKRAYRCLCDCGTERSVVGTSLRNGDTRSCGCLHREVSRAHGMIGQRYDRLVVMGELADRSRHGDISYQVRCDCGTERSVSGDSLRRGNTKSCGCLQREVSREWNTTHGMSHHPLYKTWAGLRNRCNNPNADNWPDYGGRGITVDPRWDDFPTFVADMGPKPTPTHSIDRIDNDSGYSPDNCRWATPVEQRNNQRPPRRKAA